MSARRSLLHPRDEILQTMERIYRFRMTTTSGGNLSIREENGDVWITPARVDKGSLQREDIVHVRADGTVQGRHRPSSELPFHRAIYAARPDLRGIVHAHPVALVAFSICKQVPDPRALYQAHRVCGPVGFAPYALPGSEALGRSIAETFARGFGCVVLENHGVVTGGDTLHQAFQRFETLEFAAQTILKASMLGPPVRYLDEQAGAAPPLEGSPEEVPAPRAIGSAEKELRRQLCEMVRRSYRQRLMISTEGAFSARLDERSFLITRHGVDRQTVDAEDIVLVRDGVPEKGQTPSRSTGSHRAIYARQPGVQAIVNAYPVHASAFSVTGMPLDTRTIPESYLFLRDVTRAPFGAQLGDGEALAGQTSLASPITLIDNDGVQVCGDSVLDAFDRLEVLESTAEAILSSRALGPLVPMPEGVLRELLEAFGG